MIISDADCERSPSRSWEIKLRLLVDPDSKLDIKVYNLYFNPAPNVE